MTRYRHRVIKCVEVDAWAVTRSSAPLIAEIINNRFGADFSASASPDEFPPPWGGLAVLQVVDRKWQRWCEDHGIWDAEMVMDLQFVVFSAQEDGTIVVAMNNPAFTQTFEKVD